MYDDTPLCSPLRNEALQGFTPCNIFGTKTSKDDHCDHEEVSYIQEYDASDEDSLMFGIGIDGDSWTFKENPIYDMSEEESNEPEPFEGFIDNLVHVMSEKGRSVIIHITYFMNFFIIVSLYNGFFLR